MQIVEYKIVSCTDSKYMGKFVVDLLKEGWVLYGPPFATGYTVNQAMVQWK